MFRDSKPKDASMNNEILYRATVGYLVKNSEVNLPTKKRGIGAGFRNGYGGETNPGETCGACCVREILEEGRVKTWVQDLKPVALLRCHNRTETGQLFLCTVHVFQTKFWLGDPKETEEVGTSTWFPTSNLPVQELMLADRIWLPRFFRDQKPIVVTIRYGPRQTTLDCEVEIEKVETLPEE